MSISLQNLYDLTDVSGRIYAGNHALSDGIGRLTTRVSSLGQQNERPASFKRRWATRAVAAAACAAMPVLPMAALSVGPLALIAFGVGRERHQPQRNNAVVRWYGTLKANGILGMPEHMFVSLGQSAEASGQKKLHKIAMGIAIGLGAAGQFVRVPVALTMTGGLLADCAIQLITGLGVAAIGAAAQRLSAPRGQTQTA